MDHLLIEETQWSDENWLDAFFDQCEVTDSNGPNEPQECSLLPGALATEEQLLFGDQPEDAGTSDQLPPSEVDILADLPPRARNCIGDALRVLSALTAGKPLDKERREVFEDCIKNAASIDPDKAAQHVVKLVQELSTRARRLPSGLVLPPWTPENEDSFLQLDYEVTMSRGRIKPAAAQQLLQLQNALRATTDSDVNLRYGLQQQIRALAKDNTQVTDYILRLEHQEKFIKENRAGIMRRELHKAEICMLNGEAFCNGLYAIALDKAGNLADIAKIEKCLSCSVSNRFVRDAFPELIRLAEKYHVEIVEVEDRKIPGRASLRHALWIMEQPDRSTREKLEKARPFFEQSIGAAAQIDTEAITAELKQLKKQFEELAPQTNEDERQRITDRVKQLMDLRWSLSVALLKYATILNNAAIELNDKGLKDEALRYLDQLEKRDAMVKLDPLYQGARKLILGAQKVTEEEAIRVGQQIVNDLQQEQTAQAPPEEKSLWKTILSFAGSLLSLYLTTKAIGMMNNATTTVRRSLELWRRVRNVEIELSLSPGQQPTLVLHQDGKALPVEGVRREDGRILVREGELTQAVPLRGKLVLKCADNLAPEQAHKLIMKMLTPASMEHALDNATRLLTRQQEEIEALQKSNDTLRQQFEPSDLSTQPSRTTVTDQLTKPTLDHGVAAKTNFSGSERAIAIRKIDSLIEAKDVSGLKEFALATPDSVLAKRAVSELAAHSPANLRTILQELAHSNSHAAVPAMLWLAQNWPDAQTSQVIMTRWQSGDIFQLWKEQKVEARDLLRALDISRIHGHLPGSTDTFVTEALSHLTGHPELQRALCLALLENSRGMREYTQDHNDPTKPDQPRTFDIESVSAKCRLDALRLLINQKDAEVTNLLHKQCYCPDTQISDFARAELARIWSNEGNAQMPSLFEGGWLKGFVDDLGAHVWNDGGRVTERYSRWVQADRKAQQDKTNLISRIVESIDPEAGPQLQNEIQHNWATEPKILEKIGTRHDLIEAYRSQRKQELHLEQEREYFEVIVRHRQESLQRYIEKFCRQLDLPKPDLHLAMKFSKEAYRGVYYPGRGRITCLEELAMSDDHPSPELLRTIFHELVHAEQDALIIRKLADDLHVGLELDSKQRAELKRLYAVETGKSVATGNPPALDDKLLDTWLDAVIENRQGRVLSQARARRATLLLESNRQIAENRERQTHIDKLLPRIRSRLQTLEMQDVPFVIAVPDKAPERIMKLYQLDTLSEALTIQLNELDTAERTKAPTSQIETIQRKIIEQLRIDVRRRLVDLRLKAHRLYLQPLIEVESHTVDRKSAFFADQLHRLRRESTSRVETGELTRSNNTALRPLPNGQNLQGEHLVTSRDGHARIEHSRPSDSIFLKDLQRQRTLSEEQIGFMEREAKRMRESNNNQLREQGEQILHVVRQLRDSDPSVRARVHSEVLTDMRRQAEDRGGASGVFSTGVAAGILLTAALGWYIAHLHSSTRKEPFKAPTVRAVR